MMHGARPFRTTRRLQNFGDGRALSWFSVKNQAGGPVLVHLYDEIGWFGSSAQDFAMALKEAPGDIEMHINSPGGDVFEGIAIYNQLRQRGGNVRIIVDGLAASAASFIAMAASPGMLEMAPHSEIMIHDGFAGAIGNAADLRELADQLDRVSDNIASIYAGRTGKPQAYWREKMRAETWFTDAQAVTEGLADKVHGQEPPQDSWDLSVFARYRSAAPVHEPSTGAHSHEGPGGEAEREHSHDGDADHAGVYDPDHDGDDDSDAEGDTDHDYVLPDGSPGPDAAANHLDPALTGAAPDDPFPDEWIGNIMAALKGAQQ